MKATTSLVFSLLLAASALGGEGKWTPQQVLAQGPAWVKAQGFGLPLERLWDEEVGGGLLANAVQLPGCSGSFISAEGLLVTNHHCAAGILQEHSTPQANLSQDGYLARTRADEKKAGAFRIQVPRAFRDVTKEVLAAVPPGATDGSASRRSRRGRRPWWRSARGRPARAASSHCSTGASSSP